MRKKNIRTVCLLLMGVLTAGFGCLTAERAVSYRNAAQTAQQQERDSYTLATMNAYSFTARARELDPTATEFIVPSEHKIKGVVSGFESVAIPVESATFVGLAEGVRPISTGHDSARAYDPELDSDWNWAVLTVTCLTSGPREGWQEGYWEARVRVDAVNAAPDFYPMAEEITVHGREGGHAYDQPMLEPGGQYVLCGRYIDNPLYRYYGMDRTRAQPVPWGSYAARPSLELEGWAGYYDWMQFVADPADTEWTARAVEIAQTNNARLPVYCINDLRRLELFATGKARIVAGRSFTQEEMERSAPVCIISADLAVRNGLSVGDSLAIDLYAASYGAHITSSPHYFYIETSYTDATDSHQSVSLTIIGLYDAPAYTAAPESFPHNTVFAPYGIAQQQNPHLYGLPLCLMNPILHDRQQAAFYEELAAAELPEELYDTIVIGSIPMKEQAAAKAADARARLITAAVITGAGLLGTLVLWAVTRCRKPKEAATDEATDQAADP